MAEFNFIRSEPDQVYLLAPDARQWLPVGHLAWQVLDSVAQMDLSGFLGAYRRDGQGAAAYHPAMMVASVLYSYCKGVRSSRAMEAASYDDVGVRVILGNHHPDHATFARFVERHRERMKPLFVQVLAQCARAGLVTVDLVASDGTKVKANASMQANATAEDLDIDIATLETVLDAEVDKWFEQHQQRDTVDDVLFGADEDDAAGDDERGGGPPPSSLSRLVDTIARRHAARAKLAEQEHARRQEAEAEHVQRVATAEAAVASREHHYQDQYQQQQSKVDAYQKRRADKHAAGQTAKPTGPPPIAPEQHSKVIRAATRLDRARQRLADLHANTPTEKPVKINTTDPSSRVMRGKHGEYLQFHNVQAVANSRQIILSIRRHNNPADVAALHPNLDDARANLDAANITDPIGAALFDAGYASADNFTTACQPTLYVAVTKEARQTGRRTDPAPKKIRSWQQMADRLATQDGKTLYKRRGAIIEPIFGQLFQRLGRHLNYRGAKADPELYLWGATHNLLKLFRQQHHDSAEATT